VTPTFTLSAEYSDNIFLTSRDRKSDVVVGLTPGVTLGIQRPSFRLLAGYNTRGEIFIDNSDLSDFGKEQNFFTDLYYQLSPTVAFTLNDTFVFSRDSSRLTTGGVSTGRRDAWRNTLTPQLSWQATQTTSLSLLGSYSILRFSDTGETPIGETQTAGDERDSDTYRVALGASRRFTQRLSGSARFEVGYFDIQGEPTALTYTPTVGVNYDVTPTLQVYGGGGPSFVDRDGETSLFPAIRVGLSKAFKFGSVELGYDRSVLAETIGLSDQQTVFASLVMPNLLRGLRLSFTPRYTIADTDIGDSSRNTDNNGTVKTFSLTLQATYQIARNISLIGSYTYYKETSSERNVGDIDQNRVFLGVQYAFPINFY
jgi:hypothetical protein